MNREQFEGFWKNLKAPLQQKWNKLTDEDLLEIDGNMMKFNEVIDTRYGKRKEEVSLWANRRYAHASGMLRWSRVGQKDQPLAFTNWERGLLGHSSLTVRDDSSTLKT